MVFIKSGTQSSRRSTGSRSKRKSPLCWLEPRLADYYPGNRLVVVTDVGRNVTVLGLTNEALNYYAYEIYAAPGKNLTLGQVYMAWLQGTYALKRHAEAMNLAMSRKQKRELKAVVPGLALDSWQRELIRITLGR